MLYQSLTERLLNQHTVITAIVSSLNNEKLDCRPETDKWSIHDHIVHLATYQPVFLGRLRQILSEDEPFFNRYVADVDENFIALRNMPVTELLAKISDDRKDIVNLVLSLDETGHRRTGRHLKYGNLTVLEWTEFFLLHEAHHLFAIFQLAHS